MGAVGEGAAIESATSLDLSLRQDADYCALCSAAGEIRHSMLSARDATEAPADTERADYGAHCAGLRSDPGHSSSSPRAPPLHGIV
jgi:hypothetical protein